MTSPLVSIIVPTYNQEAFVQSAIDTAALQDYEPLEVIVCDDDSSDRTKEIIRRCQEKYPHRVRAYLDHSHLGITANCNRALRYCRGEYVAFSAGDDEYLPGKIARQVAWFQADPGRVLCFHDVEVFENRSGSRLYLWKDRFPLEAGCGPGLLLTRGCTFPGLSVMVRRSALPAGGYDERLPVASDYKLWIDCLSQGGAYGPVQGTLARLRRHEAAAMVEPRLSHQALLDSVRTIELVEHECPELSRFCRRGLAVALTRLAVWHLLHDDSRSARRTIARAMSLGPFPNWRSIPILFLTFLPFTALKAAMTLVFPLMGRPDLWTHLVARPAKRTGSNGPGGGGYAE